MLKYRLSNRQRKELEERGRRLVIAIPLPDDTEEGADALHVARRLLDLPSEWVRATEIVEVPVCLGTSGLAGLLGEIVHRDSPPPVERLIVRVVCLVSDVCAVRSPRHEAKMQWPAAVSIGGVWHTQLQGS